MRSIIYLHGFHSSPMSEKAKLFVEYVEQNHPEIRVHAPQLAVYPIDAINTVETLVAELKNSTELLGIVGSSLGGYISTYIHNKYDVPAVVINPAVKPFELLEEYIGEQIHPITGEQYVLEPRHMLQLKHIYQSKIKNPDKVWCLQQEGDEVLDYRQACEHYKEAILTLEPGGDHSFVGFNRHLPKIVEFFL